MKQAKNIREQLREYMGKVRWKEMQGFLGLKEKGREIERQSGLVRRAMAEGFFMNACRKASSIKA